MALDLDQRLRVFFGSADQTRHVVPVLEISHSQLPRTYYLWREGASGEIVLETGDVVHVEGAAFDYDLAGTPAHLDQEYSFNLSTLGVEDQFREALDAIPLDTREKILMVYREYLSDDLTHPEITARLQVENISYKPGSATITAVNPRLNVTRTGELYTPRDIPMLRSFL